MPHGTADNIREENMVQNCKLCKFSLETNRTDNAGVVLVLCRRDPPSIIQLENGMLLEQSAWPTVRFNGWCGEFKFAKEPQQ